MSMQSRGTFLATTMILSIALSVLLVLFSIMYIFLALLGSATALFVLIVIAAAQVAVTIATTGRACGYAAADAVKAAGHLLTGIVFSIVYVFDVFLILMVVEFIAFGFTVIMALVNSKACARIA